MSKHWYFFTLTGRKSNLNTEVHLHAIIILGQNYSYYINYAQTRDDSRKVNFLHPL